MNIRRFRASDAQAASALVRDALLTCCAKDYPPETLGSFAETQTPACMLERNRTTHFYVAEENGIVLGCGAVAPGDTEEEACIYSFYVLPARQRRGIGTALMAALEADDSASGAQLFRIHASRTALGFYRKMGYAFAGDGRPDAEGLYDMEKRVCRNRDRAEPSGGKQSPETAAARRSPVTVRFAREEDLDRVNVLRKQVFDLHVSGKPDVFKPEFSETLRDYIHVIWNDPEQRIAVAEQDGAVCGFAVLHHIRKPENPFMYERDFLDIDEFCVDERHRRRGVATAMLGFIRDWAREQGYRRVELNAWEFNRNAIACYEAAGFTTYRRYMEMFL